MYLGHMYLGPLQISAIGRIVWISKGEPFGGLGPRVGPEKEIPYED